MCADCDQIIEGNGQAFFLMGKAWESTCLRISKLFYLRCLDFISGKLIMYQNTYKLHGFNDETPTKDIRRLCNGHSNELWKSFTVRNNHDEDFVFKVEEKHVKENKN